jgi:predicted enzyme related to lactoylglutathione lyase
MATPNHSPGSFCWFECGTPDPEAAKKFYTGLFGWNAVDVPMPAGMEGNYTLLKIGDDDIAGMYRMAGPQFEGVPPHWMTYVSVEDVDDTANRAKSLGGQVNHGPMDVPGVGRVAFLQDPTGAGIALFKAGEHCGAAQLGPVPGSFGWSELATNDTKAARAFYTELFRWGVKEAENAPMPYTEFQLGGQSIGGMMALTPQHGDAPPNWLPYVMVEDCAVSAGKVAELGGQIIVPATHIPNVGDFAVFADPTGAVLAIIQLET